MGGGAKATTCSLSMERPLHRSMARALRIIFWGRGDSAATHLLTGFMGRPSPEENGSAAAHPYIASTLIHRLHSARHFAQRLSMATRIIGRIIFSRSPTGIRPSRTPHFPPSLLWHSACRRFLPWADREVVRNKPQLAGRRES